METGTKKQPDLLIFQAYNKALLAYAKRLDSEEKPLEASKAYKSSLIFGWHLTEERPSLITFMLGVSIELQAAKAYSRFLIRRGALEKSQKADTFAEYLIELRKLTGAKAQVYLGEFDNFNCLYATVKIAKEDKDYFWRQEAVLRLGVLRHGAPDRALKNHVKDPVSQKLAKDTLVLLAKSDPQPWVRQLALWSIQNVTPERFDEMRQTLLENMGKPDAGEEPEKKTDAKPE